MTQLAGSPQIAWLIPCYNEAVTIARQIAEIRQQCPGSAIYVYDNASSDDTARLAAQAGAIVVSELRRGKGHVVRSMFDQIDADLYILVDGDDTYDISGWRKLIQPVLDHRADMVVGTRLQESGEAAFRPMHRFGNRLITSTINAFFRTGLEDVLSGYRAFSAEFVKCIALNARGFEIESELTIQALENRFTITEVTLPYKERPEGSVSKLNTFQDGFLIMYSIMRLVKDYKPLTFFGGIGVGLGGMAIVNLIQIHPDERITATIPIRDLRTATGFLLMATVQGEVKRTKIEEYANLRANGLVTFDLNPDDRLSWIKHTFGESQIVMTTVSGMAIQFPEVDVRASGRASGGVRGIRLDGPEDKVVAVDLVTGGAPDLLVVSERGMGKRTPMSAYRNQSRGGKGIKTMNLTDKTGCLVASCIVSREAQDDLRLVIVTEQGIGIQMMVGEVKATDGRSTQGVKLINLAENDKVKTVECVDISKSDVELEG